MLHCQSGEVSVGRQWPSGSGIPQILTEDLPVMLPWIQYHRVRLLQPVANHPNCLDQGKGIVKYTQIRRNPDKGRERERREAKGSEREKRLLQPLTSLLVHRTLRVTRATKRIGVDQD